MSDTLERVRLLVRRGRFRLSLHGFRELAADDILLDDILDGLMAAVVVEDYIEATRGPSVLVLQNDAAGRPIHVVWGIEKARGEPAVIVTAYRPDPERWSVDFITRRQKA